jgi:tripartite-type tricarboxylate transporter receptor subunit TctC
MKQKYLSETLEFFSLNFLHNKYQMNKLLLVLLLTISSISYSQTIITVPTTAGGSVDTMARKFAKFAELKTGTTFVIENVGGAGGNIGLAKFLKSPPNSLMISSSSWYLSINQGKFNLEDFKPIRILAESPLFLAVNSTQSMTCEKFKNTSSKIFLGTATMSQTEIVGKMIIDKYPNVENVPYKAVKPAIIDLMGNHVNAVVTGSATEVVSPLIAIANSSNRQINNIPSFNECLGINNPITMDFLLLATKNSDIKFLESMSLLVTEFTKDKDIQDYYKENIMYPNNTGITKINSIVVSQLKRWKELEK